MTITNSIALWMRLQRFALVVALCLALAGLFSAFAGAEMAYAAEAPEKAASAAAEGIIASVGGNAQATWTSLAAGAGDSTTDWMAAALALSGHKEGASDYLAALEAYVTKAYSKTDKLDRNKATEWHRIILVVKALGGDPTAFGKDASGNPINLVADGTYNWSQTLSLGAQGTNGFIWALLALDCGGYEVPADALYTRDDIIAEILGAQTSDGGIGLTRGSSDVDITAMALQALAPYAQREDVAPVVEECLQFLSDAQHADGSMYYGGQGSSESCAQTIIACTALGIDPRTSSEFSKMGVSVYDALLTYRLSDGTFVHQKSLIGSGTDPMATEQALLALISLVKFDAGQGSVYDLSTDVPSAISFNGLPLLPVAGGAVVIIALVAFVILRKKGATAGALGKDGNHA